MGDISSNGWQYNNLGHIKGQVHPIVFPQDICIFRDNYSPPLTHVDAFRSALMNVVKYLRWQIIKLSWEVIKNQDTSYTVGTVSSFWSSVVYIVYSETL